MASWMEFELHAPDLAAVAAKLWPGITELATGKRLSATPFFSIAYLATTRLDGSPRLHPICPIIAAGNLYGAIPRSSPKGDDLRRDPRCVIHAQPGPEDDELCIRANAIEVNEPGARAGVAVVVSASGAGRMLETVRNDPLFQFDLVPVDVARWANIRQPGTYAERQRWVSGNRL